MAVTEDENTLSEAFIIINLLDSNDNSPVFVTSPVIFNVSEDACIGDVVGILEVNYKTKLFNVNNWKSKKQTNFFFQAIDSDSGLNGNLTYGLNSENE